MNPELAAVDVEKQFVRYRRQLNEVLGQRDILAAAIKDIEQAAIHGNLEAVLYVTRMGGVREAMCQYG